MSGGAAVFCESHPDVAASKGFIVRFYQVSQWARTYQDAEYLLQKIRLEKSEHRFDDRDYRGNELSFRYLAGEWLDEKKPDVGRHRHREISHYFEKFSAVWGDINIKNIRKAEIDKFFRNLDRSSKTKHNMVSDLKEFFNWFKDREKDRIPFSLPDFPKVKVEMRLRKIIDIETQIEILDELKRLYYDTEPKVWFGITLLSIYSSIRPGELLNIREGDFDLRLGGVWIPRPKERRPKFIPLLEEYLEFIRTQPPATPNVYFFRHATSKTGGTQVNDRYGRQYLRRAWYQACKNLDIEGVELYSGTKHSGIVERRQAGESPETIMRSSHISTNKAMGRYMQLTDRETRDYYEKLSKEREAIRVRKKEKDEKKILKFKSRSK